MVLILFNIFICVVVGVIIIIIIIIIIKLFLVLLIYNHKIMDQIVQPYKQAQHKILSKKYLYCNFTIVL